MPGQQKGSKGDAEFSIDTKVGAQGVMKFGNQFSATVQVISKYNGEDNWDPQVEWGFAKWQATPALSLRVGRMGLPVFAVSDFRDVNYANLWVRPPLDVYGQVPVSHFDGADINWQISLGDINVSTQLFGGESSSVYEGTDIELKKLIGFNASADFGNGLTVRLGHVETELTVKSGSLPLLLGGLQLAGFGGVAKQIDPTKTPSTFTGLGVTYDQDEWIGSAEYTKRRTQSYIADTTGWYVTAGRRFGNFTPYVTFARRLVDDSNVDNVIPETPIPDLEFLRQTVNGLIDDQRNGQKSVGLGLRWDAWRNTAIKLQWDRIRTGSGDHGVYTSHQPGFDGSNVLSASVDVVF